jgi:hypothetical protein
MKLSVSGYLVLLCLCGCNSSAGTANADSVNTSAKLLASNVVLDKTFTNLSSTNLQTALNDQLAVSLKKTLAGTTWTIANKTTDSTFTGTTGQITFAAGSFTLDSGRFAASGMAAATENIFCAKPLDPIKYELINESVIDVTWTGQDRNNPAQLIPQEAVITIASKSKDNLVLVGMGGCGAVGTPRISVLKKVP